MHVCVLEYVQKSTPVGPTPSVSHNKYRNVGYAPVTLVFSFTLLRRLMSNFIVISALLAANITSLPLGSVSPIGWLATQLQIDRAGLPGSLSQFYADVAASTWIGGDATEDSGLHERMPYWLNGATVLAYLLPEDEPISAPRCAAADELAGGGGRAEAEHAGRVLVQDAAASGRTAALPPQLCAVDVEVAPFSLRREVGRVVNHILDNQQPNGWLGGEQNDFPHDSDQYWPSWYIIYALMNYAEAEPSAAPRIQASLLLYVGELSLRLDATGMTGWSAIRWPELVAILQQMVDTFDLPTGSAERALLLGTAAQVASLGFDWVAYFTDPLALPNFNVSSLPFAATWTLTEHGVNHAMALKEGAVRWRAGGGASAHALSRLKVSMLDTAHGMPTGAFSADECLAGRDPNRGVELCTIVETAYSLGVLHRTHGVSLGLPNAALYDNEKLCRYR